MNRILFFAAAILWGALLPLMAETAATGKTFAPVDDLNASATKPLNRFVVVPGKEPGGWSFTLEPYLWAMGMAGDISVKGLPATHVDYNIKTVLQHLDWGVMGRAELRNGRWGILGDGFFAQLSASGTPPGPLYNGTNLKVQQGMASLALAFRLIDDRRGFLDIYAGARYNYFGINLDSSVNSSGIQNASENAVQRISNGIRQRVDGVISQNLNALPSDVANSVKQTVGGKALEKLSGLRGDLSGTIDRRDVLRLINKVQNGTGEYRELIAAIAQARLAAAKNQLTAAIQNRVSQAEKKLAKALAREIEDALPISWEGRQWWVDPIIGLRGQINFTRWLFLAAQGDAGGFGAGSQIAWNAQATIGVNFTRNIFAELGYRYFYMDYQNDGALYNAAEFGIFSGIGVRF